MDENPITKSIEPALAEPGTDLRRSTVESMNKRMANDVFQCLGPDGKVKSTRVATKQKTTPQPATSLQTSQFLPGNDDAAS